MVTAERESPDESESPNACAVSVRLEWIDDRIVTVPIVVVEHDHERQEIQVDGRVIGFVQRVGHVVVGLSGSRLDRAVECGQCLLWDQAVAQLIIADGHLPKCA